MGVSYSAMIIVGLPRDEMGDVDEEIIEGMDQCPPHYDGGDKAVIGYEVAGTPNYGRIELGLDVGEVAELKKQFKDETGLDAKLYLSTCGY